MLYDPVNGLNISKGKSDGQVFLDKGQPFGRSFCFQHNQEGLGQLLKVIPCVQNKTGVSPTVILESTGHYHQAVIQFLEEHSISFLVVNPLISHQAKKSSLRKVKTDTVDAYRLCELYYKEDFEDHRQQGTELINLRNLTRQFDALTQTYVQIKLQFQAVLDQVFPDYRGIFGDLYSSVSLLLLKQFPTPSAFQSTDEDNIALAIARLCPSRSDRWASDKASLIVLLL